MDQGLRPQHRIRKPATFKNIFNHGRFASGGCLNLWCHREALRPQEKPGPKLGLVITRRVSPKATERNLWKRRAREVFRRLRAKIHPDAAIMVQSRKFIKVPTYQAIETEFKKLLIQTESMK